MVIILKAEWRDVTWASQEGECLRGIWDCVGLFVIREFVFGY